MTGLPKLAPRLIEHHPSSPEASRRLMRSGSSLCSPLTVIPETVAEDCDEKSQPSPRQPRYRVKSSWITLEAIADE